MIKYLIVETLPGDVLARVPEIAQTGSYLIGDNYYLN